MILKSLRIAAIAATVLGSAVAAQAAESMMDKPVVGKNMTTTTSDTGGPVQKAGATKHGSTMHKTMKKPMKSSKRHMKPMASENAMSSGGAGGKGQPKTGM